MWQWNRPLLQSLLKGNGVGAGTYADFISCWLENCQLLDSWLSSNTPLTWNDNMDFRQYFQTLHFCKYNPFCHACLWKEQTTTMAASICACFVHSLSTVQSLEIWQQNKCRETIVDDLEHMNLVSAATLHRNLLFLLCWKAVILSATMVEQQSF